MHVTVLADRLAYGGYSRIVVELAHGLQASGHRVTLVVHRDAPVDWPVLCPVARAEAWTPDAVPQGDVAVATDYETFDAAVGACRCAIRLVGRFDPTYAPEPERALRTIREAPVLWTVSESLCKTMMHHLGKRAAAVLAPGVDPAVFHPRPRQPGGTPKVLLLAAPEGGGHPFRGLSDAFRALTLVRREVASVEFHAVCRGGVRPPGDGWILHGRLSDEQMAILYSTCDVLVHPAPSDRVPMSFLEAMACGTPVVGVYADGVDEIAVSGYNALLVPRGDPDRLARMIVRVLTDPALRQHVVAGGRETVRDRTWNKMYRQAAAALMRAVSTCQ
ncbi:MAG: glycosyltransferase family 4 protein [Alicyclobacillaceae bacterium]|nr:glycosyltransferase family 4 protein [Alicyclobacillaceae bacterium]